MAEPVKLPPAPELLASHDTASLRKLRAALSVRNDPAALANSLANFATMLLDTQIANPDRIARDKTAADTAAAAEKVKENEDKAKADAAAKAAMPAVAALTPAAVAPKPAVPQL
jgi:hypothetical protein